MPDTNIKKIDWTLILQIATFAAVIIGAIFNWIYKDSIEASLNGTQGEILLQTQKAVTIQANIAAAKDLAELVHDLKPKVSIDSATEIACIQETCILKVKLKNLGKYNVIIKPILVYLSKVPPDHSKAAQLLSSEVDVPFENNNLRKEISEGYELKYFTEYTNNVNAGHELYTDLRFAQDFKEPGFITVAYKVQTDKQVTETIKNFLKGGDYYGSDKLYQSVVILNRAVPNKP